jgi:hypothetical protein
MGKPDGGAAFPTPSNFTIQDGVTPAARGMTLRDYFAGQVLANSSTVAHPKDVAETAYAIADAMLKEREK